jgi:hypothetical protein
VRDWRSIADRRHANTGLVDRTDSRLTAPARPFDPNLDLTHAGIESFASNLGRRLLGREWRPLTRTSEATSSRRGLGYQIALRICDRDERVVERRRNMNDPDGNILFLFLFESLFLGCCCFCQFCSMIGDQCSVANDRCRFTDH